MGKHHNARLFSKNFILGRNFQENAGLQAE